MRILIVDDSRINQAIARDTLIANHIEGEIFFASNGEEALTFIMASKCDLVLLDIIMPKYSGIEVLEKLMDNNCVDLPKIIMLTTIEDTQTLKKCFDYGATDYIRKPFNELEFVSRVKAVIREIQNDYQIKCAAIQMEKQNAELMATNKALKEAQYYLVQKEKMVAIGELAAGIAHEINNPLAFVMSNLSTAKDYVNSISEFISMSREMSSIERAEDYAEAISKMERLWKDRDLDFIFEDFEDVLIDSETGLKRVAKIVMTMRNFARISDEDVYEYVDMNVLIDEALLIVNNEIKYSATIIKHYSDCKLLYCNKGQIEQVLVNMLVNASHAIKAKNHGNLGVVELSTLCDEKYGYMIIKDNGGGIDSEFINKIFNPFFTTKPVGQGTGLGLSISHDIIVNKHQGEISVESIKNEGATFTIKIPFNLEHKVESEK
ncbi:response regulator [Fusibacter ferrireducens]|uniref:Stage 0 sporulation protein A homolog n=1 Tax=Fusibacter ferrireducens TaxID=2785058 RepID=A0ABR9ZUG4_9FIRM|nr:response regulator [Fusibacter ferrireducens]MBF4693798.1 response regulator [Fusibacter ferrireducens]